MKWKEAGGGQAAFAPAAAPSAAPANKEDTPLGKLVRTIVWTAAQKCSMALPILASLLASLLPPPLRRRARVAVRCGCRGGSGTLPSHARTYHALSLSPRDAL